MLLTSDGKLELEMDKLIGEAYARSPRKKRKWRDKCVLQLWPDFGKWKQKEWLDLQETPESFRAQVCFVQVIWKWLDPVTRDVL